MLKGFLAGLAFAIIALIIYLGFHVGAIKSVDITEGDRPAMYVLYQEHVGPYYKISQKIAYVEQEAKRMGFDCQKTFGEYFDDPDDVEESRLRSRGGCVSAKPYVNVPEKFKTDMIPAQKYVIGRKAL